MEQHSKPELAASPADETRFAQPLHTEIPIEQPANSGSLVERPIVPSVLVSVLLHIAFALILSLVVYGAQREQNSTELLVSQSDFVAIEQAPAFELTPVPPKPEDQLVVAETKIELPEFQLPPPQLAEAKVVEPSTEAEPVVESVDSGAASAALEVPVSKVAISIQKRVADAGGKPGEVQFALAWKNVNDVDLHVIAPSGERISHLHKRSPTGGTLDVDMNVRGESVEPVENVRWISNAPWGRYTVLINLFRVHRPKSNSRVYRGSQFQLLAQLGSESQIKSDTVSSRGSQVAVFRFQYVPQTLPASQRAQLLRELETLQEQEEAMAAPLLEEARGTTSRQLRDRRLNNLIIRFPHTDAAIQAMKLLGGNIDKA